MKKTYLSTIGTCVVSYVKCETFLTSKFPLLLWRQSIHRSEECHCDLWRKSRILMCDLASTRVILRSTETAADGFTPCQPSLLIHYQQRWAGSSRCRHIWGPTGRWRRTGRRSRPAAWGWWGSEDSWWGRCGWSHRWISGLKEEEAGEKKKNSHTKEKVSGFKCLKMTQPLCYILWWVV